MIGRVGRALTHQEQNTMDFYADSSRLRQSRLVLACMMLGFVVSWVLLAPGAIVSAQEAENPAPAKVDGGEAVPVAEGKPNPIAHFFASIGIVFGIIFATISVAIVALIIVLMMDLRMGEA